MTAKVRLQPANLEFTVEPEETLLEAALRQEILLPYGCRDGACGACRVQRVAGETVYRNGFEPNNLSPEEKAQGVILACCAQARGDVTLQCQNVRRSTDIPVKTLPARVEVLERLAEDVMDIRLRLPASETFQFLAGQYIDILLKDGRRRAFSLASAPHQTGLLELHVRRIPGGEFTTHVFEGMKVRDILRFNGPHGSFYLREGHGPILMVAGGTGFAPMKSLVEHMLHEGIERPVYLYWGARDEAGLYQRALAESWEADHGNIHFVPVLQAPGAGWTGRTGLVHEAALADHGDMAGYQVYVCGAPGMVQAARRDFLANAHLPPESFFADSFEFAAPPQQP